MNLTKDDEVLLEAINAEQDPVLVSRKIYDYYHDLDRANRTPREYLYLHLGMLHGAVSNLVGKSLAEDIPALYDAAKKICHERGITYTDPRTGVVYPPPTPKVH